MTEEMKVNDATRYLVVEFGGVQNSISADFKVLSAHDNEGDARKSAEEVARKNDGTNYGVFQKLATATLVHSVEWKGAAR